MKTVLFFLTLLIITTATSAQDNLKAYCLSCTAQEAKTLVQDAEKASGYKLTATNVDNRKGITYTLSRGQENITLFFMGTDKYDLSQVSGNYEAVTALYTRLFGRANPQPKDYWATGWKGQKYDVRFTRKENAATIRFF